MSESGSFQLPSIVCSSAEHPPNISTNSLKVSTNFDFSIDWLLL